ncbi:MAG: ribosome small subunit-dependent GTPase A [Actinocatenispora sp.]
MAAKRREYDEDDVRVRPGRSSRPRTRIRPRHTDAMPGFVVAVDRGRYTCVLTGEDRTVTAMRARELGRKSVVVGDQVALVGDVGGGPDSLARIVRIEPRSSALRRTADDDDPSDRERVIVANADQLVIVCSLQDPPPRTGFIDRCLVAAFDAGVRPLLCLTKADLPDASAARDELVRYYADLELEAVSCRPDEPLTELDSRLTDALSVLIGHSGVGKSTLVNRLVPGAGRAVGVVNAIGRGRHTSTSAVALPLDGVDGWLVDTPGVRSFGLAHVSAETLLRAFPDLVEGSEDCPPNCGHDAHAARCGLDPWVASGHGSAHRLESYRRLLASRSGDSGLWDAGA